LVTSVVYPDLQAANQSPAGLPLRQPKRPVMAAVNNGPAAQRALHMGTSGLDLIVLLMLAATVVRLPRRWRGMKSRRARRPGALVLGSLLVMVIGLMVLPLGTGFLVRSDDFSRSVGSDDSSRFSAATEVATTNLTPKLMAVQSNPPLPAPGDPNWNQYQTELAQPKNDVGVMPNRPNEPANASTIQPDHRHAGPRHHV
jgi:hypothetical protein